MSAQWPDFTLLELAGEGPLLFDSKPVRMRREREREREARRERLSFCSARDACVGATLKRPPLALCCRKLIPLEEEGEEIRFGAVGITGVAEGLGRKGMAKITQRWTKGRGK